MEDQRTQAWIEATDTAIRTLQEWQRKLKLWQRQGCDSGEFHAALFTLRSAGLEQWADLNPAGLDALANEVIHPGSVEAMMVARAWTGSPR